MSLIHIENPNAMPMTEAIARAFASFNCAPLGGASTDGWSKISDLQRCPYRYYLRNEAHALPAPDTVLRPASALDIGSLVHVCLALHYGRLLPKGYPGWRANFPPPIEFVDKVQALGAEINNVQAARALYYGYAEHWSSEDIKPVAIEYGAGIEGIHTCRFDMLAWNEGRLWNFEHKSAFAPTVDVLESWWLDGEILGEMYAWNLSKLEEVFHGKLAGVVINLMFKTRPPTYRRLEIVVPDKVLEAYARDRQFWGQQRAQFRRTGHWPRSLQGCLSRYDMCAYWAHCRDENASALLSKEAP